MEPLVFINIGYEVKNGRIYCLKSKACRRVFLERFYRLYPDIRMRGKKLELSKFVYRLMFEQPGQFNSQENLETLPEVSYFGKTVMESPKFENQSIFGNEPLNNKPTEDVKIKISEILNDEKKRTKLIGKIFSEFRGSFTRDARRTIEHWQQSIKKLVYDADCELFTFEAFNHIDTYKEYLKIIDNVTMYTEIIHFEMFLDLISRKDRFLRKKPDSKHPTAK